MHETVSESFPCVEGKFCGWENQQNNITTFIKMQTDTRKWIMMLSVLPTDTHQCTVDATVHIFIKKDMKNSSPIIFFISTKKMFGNVRLISTAVVNCSCR